MLITTSLSVPLFLVATYGHLHAPGLVIGLVGFLHTLLLVLCCFAPSPASRALELFEALTVVLNHQAAERWVANWLSLCVRVSHLHVHVHTLCDCRTFIRSIILSRTRYQQEKLQYLNWICHFVTLYWYCLYYQSSSQSIWVSFFLAMKTNDVMTDVLIIDIELYV